MHISVDAEQIYDEASDSYDIGGKKKLKTAQLIDFYVDLVSDHPVIVALHEPFDAKVKMWL